MHLLLHGRTYLLASSLTFRSAGPRSPLLAGLECSTAAGAEIPPFLRHACSDAVNVGDKFLTEALRVTFTGSSLLRSSLRAGRNIHQNKSTQGDNAENKPSMV
jgi:hypothetical protein